MFKQHVIDVITKKTTQNQLFSAHASVIQYKFDSSDKSHKTVTKPSQNCHKTVTKPS